MTMANLGAAVLDPVLGGLVLLFFPFFAVYLSLFISPPFFFFSSRKNCYTHLLALCFPCHKPDPSTFSFFPPRHRFPFSYVPPELCTNELAASF